MPLVWTRAPASRFASITATLKPREAAVRAAASPAKLAPTIRTSNCMGVAPVVSSAKEIRAIAAEFRRRVRIRRAGFAPFQRRDPERRDPVPVLAQHLEAEAVEGEGLAGLGDDARFVDDEAGDGRRLLVGQVPVHRAVEVADRHRAVDVDRAVRLRAHALHGDVVLVGDVADDLLEDVLERHQPLHLAILVDDQRDVRLALEEGVELVVEAGRIGHEPRLGGDGADVDLGGVAADPSLIACRRSLAWTMPTMFSGSFSQTGTRRIGRRQDLVDRPSRAAPATSTERMLVRWTMTSATSSSPKRKRLWMYSACDLLHLAVLGRDLDQALDLGVGQDLLVRRFPDAEGAEDRARGAVEQPVQRDRRGRRRRRADRRSTATPARARGSPGSSAPARRGRCGARRRRRKPTRNAVKWSAAAGHAERRRGAARGGRRRSARRSSRGRARPW